MDIAWRPRRGWPAVSWRLPGRVRGWLPGRLPGRVRGTDAVLAAGLMIAFSEPGFNPYHHDSGTVWAVAGVLGAVSLAWRRAAPRAVWLVTTVTGTWLLLTRHGPDWGGLSPLVLVPAALAGLYGLAGEATRRAGQLATAVTLGALEAGLLARPVRPEAVAMVAALAVTAWAAGESATARARAQRAEREARELRAAAGERARIARELHDIVAHHVSVISLQAGTARLLAESGTPPDAGLLSGIETASRQAMTELRHALGVLSHVGGAGVGPRKPAGHTPGGAEPPPGLARLGELTAGSGLDVTVDGAPGSLPAALELTAYRVIQESLTNVLRHSAARAARVTFGRTDGELHVTVTDDGPARGAPAVRAGGVAGGGGTGPAGGAGGAGGGNGLRGLRERVAAHGGTFRAGPRSETARAGRLPGFEVSATLPVRSPASQRARRCLD